MWFCYRCWGLLFLHWIIKYCRSMRVIDNWTCPWPDYDVSPTSNDKWQTCKILRSLLDTKAGIKRRKGLTNNAYNKQRPIFEDKKLSNQYKLQVFHACLESVFLYNAKLWTMNKTTENAYHRCMLRNTINIKWPNNISSEVLYKSIKVKKGSYTIKKRCLRWFGHAVRLPAETSATQALEEAMRATKRSKGAKDPLGTKS